MSPIGVAFLETHMILKCRRTFVATVGILCLTILGLLIKVEVAGAIATCVLAVCGANSAQAIFRKPNE
jgi:hypothetical protein